MSCISCEQTPARITNLCRHDELQYKFEQITGLTLFDSTFIFICDECIELLESAYAFRHRCYTIYQQLVPNIQEESLQLPSHSKFSLNRLKTEGADSSTQIEFEDELVEDIVYAEELQHSHSLLESKEALHESHEDPVETFLSPMSSVPILETASIEAKSSSTIKPRNPKVRKSYTSAEKLEAVAQAEMLGNRKTSKLLSIDESCIRKWRHCKSELIAIEKERGTKRKPNPQWPSLEKELKNWCYEQLLTGKTLKTNEVKIRSIEIANEFGLKDFKGTPGYIYKFLNRYKIQKK